MTEYTDSELFALNFRVAEVVMGWKWFVPNPGRGLPAQRVLLSPHRPTSRFWQEARGDEPLAPDCFDHVELYTTDAGAFIALLGSLTANQGVTVILQQAHWCDTYAEINIGPAGVPEPLGVVKRPAREFGMNIMIALTLAALAACEDK